MVDVLTTEQRRLNMSRIRGKDTKPEMILRRGLHAMGFRYRLHRKGLPGKPDLVFPRYRAVIFVHGCFWHGHGCPIFKLPATRTEFWRVKIAANQERDRSAIEALQKAGWRVLIVWECAFRGAQKRRPGEVIEECADFLSQADISFTCIEGCQRQTV